MTTQEKIDAILIRRYGSLNSKHAERMRNLFRLLKPSPSLLTRVLIAIRFIKPKKSADECFLDFLEIQEINNPKRVYGAGIILN